VARGFGLAAVTDKLNVTRTPQIGGWSAGQVPVFLTVAHGAGALVGTIAQLVARLQKPFILLGPTNRFLNASCLELLRDGGAAYFDLASHLRLADSGRLVPDRAPGEVFAKFTAPPDPGAEETARKVLAVSDSLDLVEAVRKAELARVFRLYCKEALSAREVAKRCKCSRSTVMVRLGQLKRKLGCEPRRLRGLAGTFDAIEASLKDSRARRIHRQTAAFGEEDEGEGNAD
jgi:hypothetical protein